MLALFREILTNEWRPILAFSMSVLVFPNTFIPVAEALKVSPGLTFIIMGYPMLVGSLVIERKLTRRMHDRMLAGVLLGAP
jgi:hypothetical protein